MPKEKGQHLTLADRVRIEQGIKDGESFAVIARALAVSASTVSREVKQNRYPLSLKTKLTNYCAKRGSCKVMGLCEINCALTYCKKCRSSRCNSLCQEYEERLCKITQTAPFVCTGCKDYRHCSYRRYTYRAIYAHESYERRLVTTRQGISITPEELTFMVRTVKRLLGQGQSLEAIWAANQKRFPVGVRTFYNYVATGLFGIANIELVRKVRYKARKKPRLLIPRPDLFGHTYADYLLLSAEAQRGAAQMDCVMGPLSDRKCIFTLHLPRLEFQIYLLLPEHTRECVVKALDWIESLCAGRFLELFGAILTDRGVEFSDYSALERSVFGPVRRCCIYYCDPLQSGQKGSAEKNHVELRKIIPKGQSLDRLTNYQLAVVASHVNSYPRPSLGGLTPYQMASQILPKSLLEGLGITSVTADQVLMRPNLIQ